MKDRKIAMLTQGAMIAAIYVVLCMVFAPISFGEVQIRIAEALTILPVFTPAAIPGLFIGCLISNYLGGSILLDIVFGSIATLIGALGTRALRKSPLWIATLPPIVANAIIVPMVLYFGYAVTLPIPLLVLSIAVGEIVGCGILGTLLGKALKKRARDVFRKDE